MGNKKRSSQTLLRHLGFCLEARLSLGAFWRRWLECSRQWIRG